MSSDEAKESGTVTIAMTKMNGDVDAADASTTSGGATLTQPKSGTYREEEEKDNGAGPPKKRSRETEEAAKPDGGGGRGGGGCNAASGVDKAVDPKKVLVLDVEGCASSTRFARGALLPCVRDKLEGDINLLLLGALKGQIENSLQALTTILNNARSGYESGKLRGHVYPDVLPMFKWCQSQGVSVYSCSSVSVLAQKILFGHSVEGDLSKYLDGHFELGGEKGAERYQAMATSMRVNVKDMTFVSGTEEELVAAREAGIGNVVMCVRPGNAPLTDVGKEFPIVHSLEQLCEE